MSLRKTNSLTFRITLLFMTASTAVLLALGFLIRDSVDKHFEEEDLAILSSNLRPVKEELSTVSTNSELLQLSGHIIRHGSGDHKLALTVINREGSPYFSVGDNHFPATLLRSGELSNNTAKHSPAVWEANGKTFRGIVERVPTGIPEAPHAVLVSAMDISSHQHFIDMFETTLWWFVAIAAALMGLLGWVAARHGLAPLRRMQQDTAAISASRLDQRLFVKQLPAELAALGNTINGMLARLEESFRRLSDFSADIAHELRTPVSNLMTQTQVALSKPRSADEYRDILASNSEELERMARMTADMLFLAKADHGLIAPQSTRMSLSQEFSDLFEFYEAMAEEKSVRLDLRGDATIHGDRLMLRRALSNLLSNAIRHTPQGAAVSIAIEIKNGHVDICITNPSHIPAEHINRLFDRFYRVDPSRHEASDGAGLGLAITRTIVQIHGGSISAQSNAGLTTFLIRLPAHA